MLDDLVVLSLVITILSLMVARNLLFNGQQILLNIEYADSEGRPRHARLPPRKDTTLKSLSYLAKRHDLSLDPGSNRQWDRMMPDWVMEPVTSC